VFSAMMGRVGGQLGIVRLVNEEESFSRGRRGSFLFKCTRDWGDGASSTDGRQKDSSHVCCNCTYIRATGSDVGYWNSPPRCLCDSLTAAAVCATRSSEREGGYGFLYLLGVAELHCHQGPRGGCCLFATWGAPGTGRPSKCGYGNKAVWMLRGRVLRWYLWCGRRERPCRGCLWGARSRWWCRGMSTYLLLVVFEHAVSTVPRCKYHYQIGALVL